MRLLTGSTAFAPFVLLSVLLVTTSCTPIGVAAGAGATVGTAAAKEGGISQSLTDSRIDLYIHDAWFRHNTTMFRKLHLSVTEGRVLITGVVQDPQFRVDAVRIAWQAPGVKQVINEIKVENGEGFSGYSRDKWIAAQFRSKIMFDRDIESINYSAETVGGIIYLMGVARSQNELNRALGHARSIRYVRDVVSYVRIYDDGDVPNYDTSGATGYTSSISPNANSSAARSTTTSSSSMAPSSAAPAASSSYDYQPESRRGAPVESSDLAPPAN